MNCTIYDLKTSHKITRDLQAEVLSHPYRIGALINTARNISSKNKTSVIVEDCGVRECYRVTPAGHIWGAPKGWKPKWMPK